MDLTLKESILIFAVVSALYQIDGMVFTHGLLIFLHGDSKSSQNRQQGVVSLALFGISCMPPSISYNCIYISTSSCV